MIDFMFRSLTRKDFESMARTARFLDANNLPLVDIAVDPMVGGAEYDSGLPIIEVPAPDETTPPVMKSGWHCNVRLSGVREQEEIQGLAQVDAEGMQLPAASRTHFGIAFSNASTVVVYGSTEGLQYANVTLLNELTIESPQRVWQ
jgi:hypothetical protein